MLIVYGFPEQHCGSKIHSTTFGHDFGANTVMISVPTHAGEFRRQSLLDADSKTFWSVLVNTADGARL